MDCRQIHEWLLDAEDPREPQGTPEQLAHLQQCTECHELSAKLIRLETAWRDQPVPDEAELARTAFLKRLPKQVVVPATPGTLRSTRAVSRRWALAALVLLAVGLGGWLLLSPNEVQAAPDMVERLIDWNLALSESRDPTERGRLYADQAESLERQVHKAELPGEDHEFAQTLLDNARWLGANEDPVVEADRFNDMADHLLRRMKKADTQKNDKELGRLARHYQRVSQHGVEANLELAEARAALDPERAKKLERIARRQAARQQALVDLLEQNPSASRNEIRQALEAANKQPKHDPVKKKQKTK